MFNLRFLKDFLKFLFPFSRSPRLLVTRPGSPVADFARTRTTPSGRGLRSEVRSTPFLTAFELYVSRDVIHIYIYNISISYIIYMYIFHIK